VNAGTKSELYRKLPSVDELLRRPELVEAIAREGHIAVADAARKVVERLREKISRADSDPVTIEGEISNVAGAVSRELHDSLAYSLQPVVNATGVILHTNLGRAPLASAALDHARAAAEGYSNLELDLATGERGKRDVHLDRLFGKLFAAETGDGHASRLVSTLVVNNNAAAVWLALNTLAARGEVIVSRGELVEIGGSFRIPDVMAQSNAMLREVGTTNRTRIADYQNAINENTRVLLRVHRSNFQITGFTEQPARGELVGLARARNLVVVEDLGSGAIFDLRAIGLSEDTVSASLRAGVDVVTFSGDKLLGGPQAGMLTGSTALIQRLRANSLFRALRVDKLTYGALEATLLAYVKGDYDVIPALKMMRASKEEIGRRTEAMAQQLRYCEGLNLDVVEGESVIGGGAAPSSTLPTRLMAVTVRGLTADELQGHLRAGEPPVIARVQDGRVVIDLRTVFEAEERIIVGTLQRIAEGL